MDLAVAVRATLWCKRLMHNTMLHWRCGLLWTAEAMAMALMPSTADSVPARVGPTPAAVPWCL